LFPVTKTGNPIIDGFPSGKGWHIYVLNSLPFPADGFVCSFDVYITTPGSMRLQIWREDPILTSSTGHYHFEMIGDVEYNPTTKGAFTVGRLFTMLL
jgi:hypothetical protein